MFIRKNVRKKNQSNTDVCNERNKFKKSVKKNYQEDKKYKLSSQIKKNLYRKTKSYEKTLQATQKSKEDEQV